MQKIKRGYQHGRVGSDCTGTVTNIGTHHSENYSGELKNSVAVDPKMVSHKKVPGAVSGPK